MKMLRSDALMSPCLTWRYTLSRTWDESKPKALLIGLNPSTADHQKNDPTVTREINFAVSWGCGTLLKGNIFAYRATDPKVMKKAPDPIGPENDRWLLEMSSEADIIVCVWGTHGAFMDRGLAVRRLLGTKPLKCLGLSKEGFPKHPLYLKATTPLMDWKP